MSARTWLDAIAGLTPDDIKLVGRLAELFAAADRAKVDVARNMLDARPDPLDAADLRARIKAIIAYLED